MSEQFNKTVENATIGGKTKKDTRDLERRQRDIRDSGKAYAIKKGMQIAVIFLLVLTFALMLWNFHQSAEISAIKMVVGGMEEYSVKNLAERTDRLVSRFSNIEKQLLTLEEKSNRILIEKIAEKYFPKSKIISIEDLIAFKGLFNKEGTNRKLIGYKHGIAIVEKEGSSVRIITKYVYSDNSLILTKDKESLINDMVNVKITLLDKDNTKKYIFFVSPDDYPEIKTLTSDTKVEK